MHPDPYQADECKKLSTPITILDESSNEAKKVLTFLAKVLPLSLVCQKCSVMQT